MAYVDKMSFIRTKKIGGGTYYYLVKSVREGKRVHQVNLAYLGSKKPGKEEIKQLKEKHEEKLFDDPDRVD